MGILDWFSSGTDSKEEQTKGSIRYLCILEKEYGDMDEFMDDFFDVMEETIERYNESNPAKVEELDREQAHKLGGSWIYEANVKRQEKEPAEDKGSRGVFGQRKTFTFEVIARKQPHFAIEVSGNEDVISPFLEELKGVLTEEGFSHKVDVVGKPGLGESKSTESEGGA